MEIFKDKQFNIKDYNDELQNDLLNILLNTIITYYYRDNNNEENKDIKIQNQEKEKDIIFIIQKIIIPIVKKASLEKNATKPAFVEFDSKKMSGTYLRLPDRSELNPEINESLIVEFYNR